MKHNDVIATQTRNCMRRQIAPATPLSRHASTNHGI